MTSFQLLSLSLTFPYRVFYCLLVTDTTLLFSCLFASRSVNIFSAFS